MNLRELKNNNIKTPLSRGLGIDECWLCNEDKPYKKEYDKRLIHCKNCDSYYVNKFHVNDVVKKVDENKQI